MAKIKQLNPVNRTTWDLKIIPSNSQEIMTSMKNNLKMEEITALISIVDNVIDTYVLTPSEILYQFTVDTTNDTFDAEWWSFALKNYYVVFANSADKSYFAELLNLELKEVTGKNLKKGKDNSGLSKTSLQEIFNLVCANEIEG